MEFLLEIESICKDNYKIVICLFVMALLDILTGIIKGVYNKNYSSSELKKGLLKKPLYFIVIIAISIIQLIFQLPSKTIDILNVSVTFSFVGVFTVAFILTELTSIFENTSEYIVYPKWIVSILAKLNNDFNNIEDSNDFNNIEDLND